MTSEQTGGDGGPAREATLRDLIAIEAMSALLRNALDNEISFDGYDSFDGMIAELAYAQADAMLAARGAKP